MKTGILKTGILLSFTLLATVTWAQPTDAEVKEFTKNWFRSFDQKAPIQGFLDRIETNDLEIKFPERTLLSHQDFQDWYSDIQREIRQASHLIQSLVIEDKNENEVQATVRVIWKAEKFNGEKVEFHARQKWTLTFREDVLRIKKYFVEEDLPQKTEPQNLLSQRSGLNSDLSCICHGGPGNYTFRCAPVKKTCYGGPGYYPYECSVCSE